MGGMLFSRRDTHGYILSTHTTLNFCFTQKHNHNYTFVFTNYRQTRQKSILVLAHQQNKKSQQRQLFSTPFQRKKTFITKESVKDFKNH